MIGLNQAIAAGTASLKRRMATMIRLARLTRVDADQGTQTIQIEVFKGELHDNVKHVEPYGFTSHPLSDSEAVVVFPGGVLSNPVALVVGGRAYRLQGLKGGEVAIYDDQGQKVVLERDRILIKTDRSDGLVIEATKVEVTTTDPDGVKITTAKAEVIADKVIVKSDDISLGAEGGPRVARVGDTVVCPAGTGHITSGSEKVTAV